LAPFVVYQDLKMEKLVIINDAKEKLIAIVHGLEKETKQLSILLSSSDVTACKFIHIEPLTMEDEKQRILTGPPKTIAVENLPLNAGLESWVEKFCFFYTKYGMSTRYSPNFPGIICLTKPSSDIIHRVTMINELKAAFSFVLKDMATKLKTHLAVESIDQVVFDVIHNPMPMLLTECVTRKIQVLDEPIESASFSMRSNVKKNLIDREALIQKLETQLRKANDIGERHLAEHIHHELRLVKESRSEKFGYPKATTPTPSLTVRTTNERRTINYRACLPLIVLGQGNSTPTIHDMKNYDSQEREQRKKRTNDASAVLLYPHSGLHSYE
jgi:hypothetical protein